MAKLTKAQRAAIGSALHHAERALRYVQREDVAVCRKGGQATTTLHATRPLDGAVFQEMAKDIGSDLCGLEFAVIDLRRLIAD